MSLEWRRLVAARKRGADLSLIEAQELIEHLASEPEDLEARMLVLSFARRHWKFDELLGFPLYEHHLWFVQNEPSHDLHSLIPSAYGPLDGTCDESKIRDAWLASVARFPDDVRVLANAASYLAPCDFERAKSIWERCESLDETSEEWPSRIGELCELHADTELGRDRERTLASLNAYRRALSKCVEPEDRFHATYDVAVAYLRCGELEAARLHATALLDGAHQSLFGRESRNAEFLAHTILGLIAVAREDYDEAERELMVSARSDCAASLLGVGTSWDLAGEVLKCGRSDAVLEFLELQAERIGRGLVDRWIERIRRGELVGVFPTKFQW